MGSMGRQPKVQDAVPKVAEQTVKKVTSIGAIISQALASGSLLSVIAGTIIVTDCRLSKWDNFTAEQCYFIGAPWLGLAVAGRSGYEKGYNTFNPALHKKDEREA